MNQINKKIFSYLEPFILVNFIFKSGIYFNRVMDLGTGYGTILFLIALRFRGKHLFGLDIEKGFIKLGRDYIRSNNLEGLNLLHLDLREIYKNFLPGSFDLITFNPPYFKSGEGRHPHDPDKYTMRFEVNGTLNDFIKASEYLISEEGSIIFIYPADKFSRLDPLLKRYSLHINSLQAYSHSPDSFGSLIMYQVSRHPEFVKEHQILVRNSEEYASAYFNFF